MTSPLQTSQQITENNSELNIIDISQTMSTKNLNIDENISMTMTIYQSEIIKSKQEESKIEYNIDSSIVDKRSKNQNKENSSNKILTYASYLLAIGISIGLGSVLYKKIRKSV